MRKGQPLLFSLKSFERSEAVERLERLEPKRQLAWSDPSVGSDMAIQKNTLSKSNEAVMLGAQEPERRITRCDKGWPL
jgi:hypothetical protein